VFGIWFDQVRGGHPLDMRETTARVRPFVLIRKDRRYLVQRGGADADLSEARVLVIGCGAVGGHVAFELARAGVGQITLVDHDRLTPENSFRHALGRRYWEKAKADALKTEIEAQLPYVRVSAVVLPIEVVLDRKAVALTDYDLVVLAIGNPTVELEINERLHRAGRRGVFTWLEPFGIGGHALLVANDSDGGCFECLYTSLDETEQGLVNRAAFAAPGQAFGRAFSGCGSLHTPYGSMDAVQTAGLAARLALDALTHREQGNPLRSWKGDGEEFLGAGFAVSERYRASADELSRTQYAYRAPHCRVCQGAHQGSS
jgi:molybdopterin/thiamine biosynthesis adenylyltransferase